MNDANATSSADPCNFCPICGGKLVTKKLKYFCESCGTLCETCCDGGC